MKNFVVLFFVTLASNTYSFENDFYSYVDSNSSKRPKTIVYSPKGGVKGRPLVILLHGHGANGYLQNLYMGIRKYVESHKFLFAIPSGTKDIGGHRFWNDQILDLSFLGGHSENDPIPKINDFKFITILIRDLHQKYGFDLNQIYLIGHSNGGFFSYSYACNGDFPIKKVFVLAGGITDKLTCNKFFDITHIHGDADGLVSYDGRTNYFYSVSDMMKFWQSHLNCSEYNQKNNADLTYVKGRETEIFNWSSCRNSKKLELWKINKGSHIPIFKPRFAKKIIENILSK